LRQQFDWIIIDAPPVMAVTDAAILSNSATGVVFVVGAEMTSRRNASAAVEHLQAARAKFIGAVLNRVDLKRHAYYYSPYYRKDYTQAYHKAH
jgi:Mrp family chromosome partitioning ATPase